jgi:signal transduction histidine kinase/ActR/RegA family two-component response regulator
VDDVLPTEIVQLTHQMIREVLEHNQVKEYNYELTIGDKNYIFESRMVPLTKNSTLAIVRDVTERKEAQEALIKAKEKAEESDRLKSAFLANMSHEIRTPINGIIGFTQLLRDQEYTPEERNEFFDIIDLNSKQLLQIINDIIDISKIEANQLIIKKKTFALNQLMDELYNTYRIELSQYSKEHLDLILKKELEDDTDYVFTDMIRLKQIMTNLLGNAIKFTEQGQIEFGYKCTGKNQFIFFVKDTGIGIPKEKQKLIFSHFRRAHESMASKFGGTGLGLSISKKLVEMLGGEIWVESTENRGASFFVHIPIERKAVNASQKEQTTGEPEYQWNEFKIMIVEDNLPSQRFIKEVIKPTHADIILASSSEEALKQFHAHQDINLILMDIKLPDQDGFQTTRAIRQEDKEIPIIATTAYAMETDKKVAIKNGCNDYLAKPINKKELLKTISKYLMIKK